MRRTSVSIFYAIWRDHYSKRLNSFLRILATEPSAHEQTSMQIASFDHLPTMGGYSFSIQFEYNFSYDPKSLLSFSLLGNLWKKEKKYRANLFFIGKHLCVVIFHKPLVVSSEAQKSPLILSHSWELTTLTSCEPFSDPLPLLLPTPSVPSTLFVL